MMRKPLLLALLPDVLYAIATLILGLLLPTLLLFFSWDRPITQLANVVTVANSIKKLSDVLLVVIPLASVYSFAGLIFTYRTVAAIQAFSQSLFAFGLAFPFLVLVVSQAVMFNYLLAHRDQVLTDEHLTIAATAIYCSVIALLCIEAFMSLVRTAQFIPGFRPR